MWRHYSNTLYLSEMWEWNVQKTSMYYRCHFSAWKTKESFETPPVSYAANNSDSSISIEKNRILKGL